MSDWKSKLPDLQELGSMTKKFAGDIKKSICDIVCEYKKKHPSDASTQKKTATDKPEVKTPPKAEKKEPNKKPDKK